MHLSTRRGDAHRDAAFLTALLPLQLQLAGERDPNVSTLISRWPPSWQGDNMPAPFGSRSPDLQLPGPELSRGFSRSASRPQGQVFGGASTRWSYSRPRASRRLHWHWLMASDACVWELPDIRLSASLCVCHGPDRDQRRSCCRAAVVTLANPSVRRSIRCGNIGLVRNQCS
jgi:hypothetical protein